MEDLPPNASHITASILLDNAVSVRTSAEFLQTCYQFITYFLLCTSNWAAPTGEFRFPMDDIVEIVQAATEFATSRRATAGYPSLLQKGVDQVACLRDHALRAAMWYELKADMIMTRAFIILSLRNAVLVSKIDINHVVGIMDIVNPQITVQVERTLKSLPLTTQELIRDVLGDNCG